MQEKLQWAAIEVFLFWDNLKTLTSVFKNSCLTN